jgi:hypothetical protein
MDRSHPLAKNISISGKYGGAVSQSFVTSGSQNISGLFLTGGGDRVSMVSQAVRGNNTEQRRAESPEVRCKFSIANG